MTSDFKIGDLVEKRTGDYRATGEVRGVFTMLNGAGALRPRAQSRGRRLVRRHLFRTELRLAERPSE